MPYEQPYGTGVRSPAAPRQPSARPTSGDPTAPVFVLRQPKKQGPPVRSSTPRRDPRSLAFVRLAGLTIGAVGLVVAVGLAIADEPSGALQARGGVATFLGNLFALTGTYLALVMVLLVSRARPVERLVGQDRLVRWHRRLSPWPISLIALHAGLTTVGYAEAARTGFWSQVGSFIRSYPDMLAAIVAFLLLMLIAAMSVRFVRNRVRHETWWVLHLYLYMALALSFAHEIVLGPSFVGHPLTTAVWATAWAMTAGLVLVYRVGVPLVRTVRHQLRVVSVYPESPGVTSVICQGRRLSALKLEGGQFFAWRFLVRGLWWQAHPYSVSALPHEDYMRLTVKAVGDHSLALSRLQPGTRVAIEGPYGAFTWRSSARPHVLLIAGGIGVTAVRALLEDLPPKSKPVVVLRASTAEDLVLVDEVEQLVAAKGGQLHTVLGNRRQVRVDHRFLMGLVPDFRRREAFVCGPPGFVEHVAALLKSAGIPSSRVHHEAFGL